MPRPQRGIESRGRRDADVCQHQKAIVSSVTLAISTITAPAIDAALRQIPSLHT
jgi:hypothetical protein